MKNSRLVSIFTIFVFGISLALTGCGQQSASNGADKTTQTEENTKPSDAFPNKPITLINHSTAGSPSDICARELAKAAEQILGQPVVVENRSGGGGAIQMAAITAAKPDGYTIGTVTPSHIGGWNTTLKGQYSADSFTFIADIQIDPYCIVVNAESEFKTLQDLVDYMKKNPGKITIGSMGSVGSGNNIAWNIFAEKAGVEATWVAYEGVADSVTALLGKHIDVANSYPGTVAQYVEAGQLRILGVMSDNRAEAFPDVPTYAEAGFPVDTSWAQFRGIYGPAGIPGEITQKLSDAFLKAMETDGFKEYMKNSGMQDGSMDCNEFTEFIMKQNKTTADWLTRLGV
ncbi:MAG: tripartite tricarboxylate transporter substrate binding protein [Dehalobacterium sp.]